MADYEIRLTFTAANDSAADSETDRIIWALSRHGVPGLRFDSLRLVNPPGSSTRDGVTTTNPEGTDSEQESA
ncbi:hypothetical protein [Streptomyces syringium]|uniref:hypothetical protein n=1 Tax=Streptomyces syringium TaxID=76729 RepID=UPI003AAD48C4